MEDSKQSQITEIRLNDATFENSGVVINPNKINFFFGNNGTGKTTIAKAIKSGSSVTYINDKKHEDYNTLVFDQDFINDNVTSYHDMQGIFTFGQGNSEVQAEFDTINAQLIEVQNKKAQAECEKNEMQNTLVEFDDKAIRSQYNALKPLRDAYSKLIPARFSTSKKLIPEIRRHLLQLSPTSAMKIPTEALNPPQVPTSSTTTASTEAVNPHQAILSSRDPESLTSTDEFSTSSQTSDQISSQTSDQTSGQIFTQLPNPQLTKKQLDEDFNRLYNAIFDSNAREYQEFPEIPDTSVLDNINGAEILQIVIANAAQTDFANFLNKINATQWMRLAHQQFHDKTDGLCPYCFRPLDDQFEQQFLTSFDEQYEENLTKLDTFLQAYRDSANALFIHIRSLPKDICPQVDVKAYREKLQSLRGAISANIDQIREKISDPTKVVTLEPIKPYLEEISKLTSNINDIIKTNNDAYKAQENLIPALRQQLFLFMGRQLQRDFFAYDQMREKILARIEELTKILRTETTHIHNLRARLQTLFSRLQNTAPAIRNINAMLRAANFQGIEIRPHYLESSDSTSSKPITYAVVRTSTGEIATDLSFGEKNFIAFLYFLQKIQGTDTDQVDTRDKIIVIDDPVTGLDSNALLFISLQIRTLLQLCCSNTQNPGSIKQVFLLTHNSQLYREVSYPYLNKPHTASLYLIKKTNNKSTVLLSVSDN